MLSENVFCKCILIKNFDLFVRYIHAIFCLGYIGLRPMSISVPNLRDGSMVARSTDACANERSIDRADPSFAQDRYAHQVALHRLILLSKKNISARRI